MQLRQVFTSCGLLETAVTVSAPREVAKRRLLRRCCRHNCLQVRQADGVLVHSAAAARHSGLGMHWLIQRAAKCLLFPLWPCISCCLKYCEPIIAPRGTADAAKALQAVITLDVECIQRTELVRQCGITFLKVLHPACMLIIRKKQCYVYFLAHLTAHKGTPFRL